MKIDYYTIDRLGVYSNDFYDKFFDKKFINKNVLLNQIYDAIKLDVRPIRLNRFEVYKEETIHHPPVNKRTKEGKWKQENTVEKIIKIDKDFSSSLPYQENMSAYTLRNTKWVYHTVYGEPIKTIHRDARGEYSVRIKQQVFVQFQEITVSIQPEIKKEGVPYQPGKEVINYGTKTQLYPVWYRGGGNDCIYSLHNDSQFLASYNLLFVEEFIRIYKQHIEIDDSCANLVVPMVDKL